MFLALGEEEQCGGGADTCEEHRALLRGLGPQTQRPSSEHGHKVPLQGDVQRSSCAAAVSGGKRQRGDSNPCGQSPMDF